MKEFRISEDNARVMKGSSQGTQKKYFLDEYWYKQDCNGYEGKAEYLCSLLLQCSNVKDYVRYEECMINGRRGCRSKSFTKTGEVFQSFQRIYDMYQGGSLADKVYSIQDVRDRIEFVVEFVKKTVSLDCRRYIQDTLALDMLTLNTDRHFHNLGVIVRTDGTYAHAPIFDNGKGLMSDFLRFPPYHTYEENLENVTGAPFSGSLESQVYAAGIKLKVDVERLWAMLQKEEDSRAKTVLENQIRRYQNLIT